MLNHLIRGLLFHYKKVLFWCNFIWKGCFKKMHHLFFRVRANDVNSTKSQQKIFIWWINKMTSDKRWQTKFSGIVLRWKQFLSLKNCRSVSICSVLNRSNRDTTVYYRLIFCAFSWPNMVKWRNSGIINTFIYWLIYLYIYSITVVSTHQLIGQSIFQANALSGYKFPTASAVTRTSSFFVHDGERRFTGLWYNVGLWRTTETKYKYYRRGKRKWKMEMYKLPKKDMDKELNLLVEKGADQ